MWGTPCYSPPRGAIGEQPKVDDKSRLKLEPKLHDDRIPSIALFIRFIRFTRYLGAEQAASGEARRTVASSRKLAANAGLLLYSSFARSRI